jgi:MFS family permease
MPRPAPETVMKGRPLILASLLLAAFAINVDTTIVNVALPALVRELHASTTELEWIVDAYNLLFAALVLATGNLSDRLGRKGVLLCGLGVFGVATTAGGLVDSPGGLIGARAVMGIGAALIFPATLSLLTNVFTERRERARAIGLWERRPASGSPRDRSSAAGCSSTTRGRACSLPSPRSRRWRPCSSP